MEKDTKENSRFYNILQSIIDKNNRNNGVSTGTSATVETFEDEFDKMKDLFTEKDRKGTVSMDYEQAHTALNHNFTNSKDNIKSLIRHHEQTAEVDIDRELPLAAITHYAKAQVLGEILEDLSRYHS